MTGVAVKNKGGRPRIGTESQIEIAKNIWNNPSITLQEIEEQTGVGYRTLYRRLGARFFDEEQKAARRALN